jgi:predicted PurR-regulated permease PerM
MNINVRPRNILYIAIILFFTWLLFIEKEILGPFIVAMIFAYIFNPLINLFAKYLKLPRSISILLVYAILIGTTIFLGTLFIRSVLSEGDNIIKNINSFTIGLKDNIGYLPVWSRPYINDYLDVVVKNNVFGGLLSNSFPFVSQAFSGILSFFIFLFAAFLFLKDGKRIVDSILGYVPDEYREDAQVLLDRTNWVLNRYLRGQLVIVFSMATMIFLGLYLLGVRYALTIAVIAAILELIPFMGPLIASIIAIFLTAISGGISIFQIGLLQLILLVLLVTFIARQIQDYIIAPVVIGKATNLHPLVILFSILAGGHIYGILGVLLAVPTAAIIKILLEFSLEKVSPKKASSK